MTERYAGFVTDRSTPYASATAQLPRDTFIRFSERAAAMGTTKGALLRKFVEDFLEETA